MIHVDCARVRRTDHVREPWAKVDMLSTALAAPDVGETTNNEAAARPAGDPTKETVWTSLGTKETAMLRDKLRDARARLLAAEARTAGGVIQH